MALVVATAQTDYYLSTNTNMCCVVTARRKLFMYDDDE